MALISQIFAFFLRKAGVRHCMACIILFSAQLGMLRADILYPFQNKAQLTDFVATGSGSITWSEEDGVANFSGRLNISVNGSQTRTLYHPVPFIPGENGVTLSCLFQAEAYSNANASRIALGFSDNTSSNLSTDGVPIQGRLVKNGNTSATLEVRGALAGTARNITGIPLVDGDWYKLSVTFMPRPASKSFDIVVRLENHGPQGNAASPTLVALATGTRTEMSAYFDGTATIPLYAGMLAQNDGGGAAAVDNFRISYGLSDSIVVTGEFSSSMPGNIFTPGQPLNLNLSLDAPIAQSRDITVNLFDSTETTVATTTVRLPENEARPVVFPLNFPAREIGYYRIEAIANKERIAKSSIGILPAASTKSPDPSSRFGIVAHLKDISNDDRDILLDISNRINIGWLREGFLWHQIQPSEDTWNWSRYDDLLNRTLSYGINVLPVLCFTAEWASSAPEGSSNSDKRSYPPNPDAWARYVSTITARYKDRVKAWEIWNEQNATTFWKPAPDAYAYSILLKNSCDLVKAVDPSALLISGGLAPQTGTHPSKPEYHEITFINNITARQPDLDIIGYHPYTMLTHSSTNERYEFRYDNILSQLITPEIQDMPLWFTELGAPNIPRISSEKHVADYLTVTLLKCLATNTVEKMFIYNLRDVGTNPEDKEHMFGLLHRDNTPKPALFAIRHFIETLEQAAFVGRTSPQPGVVAYTFRTDGKTIHIVWTSDNTPIKLNMPIPALSLTLTNVTGQQIPADFDNGILRHLLTRSPVYIEYSN